MFKLVKNKWSFSVSLVVCALLILTTVSNPLVNISINDDWVFMLQVKAFLNSIYKLNVAIDPSFISQGILGYFWSLIFGFSIVKLRILTVLCSAIFIVVLSKIFKVLQIHNKITIVALCIVAFNPLFFSSNSLLLFTNFIFSSAANCPGCLSIFLTFNM